MTESLHPNRRDMPSTVQLLKATGIAVFIGSIILITAILPAEYGMDPTGLGAKLGLTALSSNHSTETTLSAPAEISPLMIQKPASSTLASGANLDMLSSYSTPTSLPAAWRSPAPFRSETQTIILQPDEGTEVKALMQEGEYFVYSWRTDGDPESFDMHGDKINAHEDDFTSYWKERESREAHGALRAPFEGNHGWYWRNRTAQAVTITLHVSGYFSKLYRP